MSLNNTSVVASSLRCVAIIFSSMRIIKRADTCTFDIDLSAVHPKYDVLSFLLWNDKLDIVFWFTHLKGGHTRCVFVNDCSTTEISLTISKRSLIFMPFSMIMDMERIIRLNLFKVSQMHLNEISYDP